MILDEIDPSLLDLAKQADAECKPIYDEIDNICFYHSNRILSAFIENNVSYSDFAEQNGYGDYDEGRNKLEKIFAAVLGCEDSLVRPQIMSGTNALYLTFSSLLKPGDTMISLTGTPYDSLQEMIGLSGDSTQSLKANGVKYEQIDLLTLENGDNDFDEATIVKRLERKDVKLVEIQRSRGYSARASLIIDKIEKIIQAIRSVNQDVIIMVDNCYGELVEYKEPGHVGADVVVGSLMKNLGGGIASTGGYVAGREDLIGFDEHCLIPPRKMGHNYHPGKKASADNTAKSKDGRADTRKYTKPKSGKPQNMKSKQFKTDKYKTGKDRPEGDKRTRNIRRTDLPERRKREESQRRKQSVTFIQGRSADRNVDRRNPDEYRNHHRCIIGNG